MKHFAKSAFVLILLIPISTEDGIAGLILKNDHIVSQPQIQKKSRKTITRSIKKSRIQNAVELGSKQTKGAKRQWHQLNGHVNGSDVFLYVKRSKYRQVTGYLVDHGGSTQYVHGEWYKGHLQIYDQSNQLLTVILYN